MKDVCQSIHSYLNNFNKPDLTVNDHSFKNVLSLDSLIVCALDDNMERSISPAPSRSTVIGQLGKQEIKSSTVRLHYPLDALIAACTRLLKARRASKFWYAFFFLVVMCSRTSFKVDIFVSRHVWL